MNEYTNEELSTIIQNEYDYSNCIPSIEYITYLVQYCSNVYDQLLRLIEEDEKRNEPLKYEYKNYNYKKMYSTEFEILIRQKTYNSISCTDYTSFKSAADNGSIKNVSSLEIKMNLDYKRGSENKFTEHTNAFKITFKPYEITFIRKSNHNENDMNQIETNIRDILNKIPAMNSIFCTK